MSHDSSAPGAAPRDRPALMAAVVNGSLIVFVPAIVGAFAIYRSTDVRPVPPTALSSIVEVLPVALGVSPIALLVAWRTYVHARAYRLSHRTAWRGPVESASIAGGLAALVMLRATAETWARQPFYQVAAYIGGYVGLTAVAGFILGLALAVMALLVLRLQR